MSSSEASAIGRIGSAGDDPVGDCTIDGVAGTCVGEDLVGDGCDTGKGIAGGVFGVVLSNGGAAFSGVP